MRSNLELSDEERSFLILLTLYDLFEVCLPIIHLYTCMHSCMHMHIALLIAYM